jgi:hypothetical protein
MLWLVTVVWLHSRASLRRERLVRGDSVGLVAAIAWIDAGSAVAASWLAEEGLC